MLGLYASGSAFSAPSAWAADITVFLSRCRSVWRALTLVLGPARAWTARRDRTGSGDATVTERQRPRQAQAGWARYTAAAGLGAAQPWRFPAGRGCVLWRAGIPCCPCRLGHDRRGVGRKPRPGTTRHKQRPRRESAGVSGPGPTAQRSPSGHPAGARGGQRSRDRSSREKVQGCDNPGWTHGGTV